MPFEVLPNDFSADYSGYPFGTPESSNQLPILSRVFPPPSPREVRLKLLSFADGIWRIEWRDTGPIGPTNPRGNPVHHWIISQTRVSAAPSESTTLNWAQNVLDRGSPITSFTSLGSGKLMSYLHNGGQGFVDYYVQVYGINDAGLAGRPSEPLRLTFSSDATTIPDETLSQALGLSTVLVNGNYFMVHQVQYGPPSVTTNFAGVELYIGNWNGTTLIEAGSLGVWDGTSRLQDFTVTLPEDTGLGSGVATFTNGAKPVVRVSGTAFGAGWAGRDMAVRVGDAVHLYSIDTVTPPNNLALLINWGDPSGDYSFVTYNQRSYYFVPVGPQGVRRPDPTASAVIVL